MQTGQLKEMIKDKTLPAPIQKALQVLHLRDIANMAAGRVEIAGEDMYADVFDAVTRRYGDQRAEAHEQYYDVQYLARGAERLHYAPQGTEGEVAARIPERDLIFYRGTPDPEYIDAVPGTVTIFAPGEIHRPTVAAGEPMEIRKAVVKVHSSLMTS